MDKTLPNFFMIGAPKSGTSALFQFLGEHPEIFVSAPKEPNYFAFVNRPPNFSGPGDANAINRKSVTSLHRYCGLFADADSHRAIGDGSTIYFSSPQAAENISQRIPDARIIAILRDPVERSYSSFLHFVRDGREPCATFEEALSDEPRRIEDGWQPLWHYTRLSHYPLHLTHYYDRFPSTQIHIILYEAFRRNPMPVLKRVFEFLDVDPTFEPDVEQSVNASGRPRSSMLHKLLLGDNPIKKTVQLLLPKRLRSEIWKKIFNMNVKRERPSPSARIRHDLEGEFMGDIAPLHQMTGEDFSEWPNSWKSHRPAIDNDVHA